MKEYIDSYLNTIQPKPKQKKLVNTKKIINEDFEKAKNNFWRTSKGKEDQLLETINNVCTKYNLRPLKVNGQLSTTLKGKREGDFNIRIQLCDTKKTNQLFWIKGVYRNINVIITDAENDEPIEGLKNTQIHMKSSWTDEELTKAINKALAPAGIKLTGANSPLKTQQIYGGAFKKIHIIDTFANSGYSNNKQVNIAKNYLVVGKNSIQMNYMSLQNYLN